MCVCVYVFKLVRLTLYIRYIYQTRRIESDFLATLDTFFYSLEKRLFHKKELTLFLRHFRLCVFRHHVLHLINLFADASVIKLQQKLPLSISMHVSQIMYIRFSWNSESSAYEFREHCLEIWILHFLEIGMEQFRICF